MCLIACVFLHRVKIKLLTNASVTTFGPSEHALYPSKILHDCLGNQLDTFSINI